MSREQIALRFPVGTKSRLSALAEPHESLTSTLLRAIDALEQQPSEQPTSAIERRLDALEQRLDALESKTQQDASSTSKQDRSRQSETVGQDQPKPARSTPLAPSGHSAYPPEARRLAVSMLDDGASNAEVCAELIARFGRAPDRKNATAVFRRWREMENET